VHDSVRSDLQSLLHVDNCNMPAVAAPLLLLLQMHLHLAEVFPSLLDAIAAVHKSGKTSSFINCTGSRQTSSCTPTDKGDVNKNIKVCATRGLCFCRCCYSRKVCPRRNPLSNVGFRLYCQRGEHVQPQVTVHTKSV
jgi:hypothetical protein